MQKPTNHLENLFGRQGVPVAIDITGKEGAIKLTDNSNFFCLGPSGKSFHINSVMRQLHEQGTDVVTVDTGNSYEGLCGYLGGKYIGYTEERPITMNPFHITREELNIEKVNFLKNLILQIWKGSNGVVSKTEDRLIGQTIDEYYKWKTLGRRKKFLPSVCFRPYGYRFQNYRHFPNFLPLRTSEDLYNRSQGNKQHLIAAPKALAEHFPRQGLPCPTLFYYSKLPEVRFVALRFHLKAAWSNLRSVYRIYREH
jgi:hypothetical protein